MIISMMSELCSSAVILNVYFLLLDLILAEVQYRVIITAQSCDKTVEITLPSVCYLLLSTFNCNYLSSFV